MSEITTILFDFDGVITNTEPQYDLFFNEVGKRYGLGIDNFATYIKGVTLPNILERFFPDHSEEDKNKIAEETIEFEKQMDFSPIPGSLKFIEYAKNAGYKIGLVTSSQDFKMKIALEQLNLTGVFDTEVTADRIVQGKPDPMCYLLGAKDLDSSPEECIVFEDAPMGIQAATGAGMKVIGLSTTVPADELKDNVFAVIPDFTNLQAVISLLK
jgi:haloacid dehalogenase superfamily, subfamily IA, variant 3 with third motif having DD or ED